MSEQISATRTIQASPEQVFDLLADPTTHRAIEGTGWVLDPTDSAPLTHEGQRFTMDMYAEQGPTGGAYRMVNTVSRLDRPAVIAWRPELAEGTRLKDGFPDHDIRGYEWRYELAPAGDGTAVTLVYDWSETSAEARSGFPFPPFPAEMLDRSLANLARLAE